MNRTIAILIIVALGCSLIAGSAISQAFAQQAASAGAAPPPTAPPAVAAPDAPHVGPAAGAPATPRLPPAPAGTPPQAGAMIRSGAAGGGIFYAPGPGGFATGGMGGYAFGAGEDDPEMSKLMQSEHELSRQSEDLVRQYGSTEDYGQREKLRTQLRELLGKQFDIQRQRRERELARIEERLSKLREQLKKRTSVRDEIIDRHLETLTSEAEGLGWTPPAAQGGGGRSPYFYYNESRPARAQNIPVAR